MKVKKKWRHLDDPMIVGYWRGRSGEPPERDDEDYMHGYNNGAVDAMRERGELDWLKRVDDK